jgi:glycosyltransferase involved in cell wall biosynthesis
MRLGGFVIHGNAATTLGRCLDGLTSVCDEVLAVDSRSTDGSAELVRERGARHLVHPWQGYGAARAVAAEALAGCDYLFFLDSDEWLEDEAVRALRAWKASSPDAPAYTLVRRDWAELPTGRFLFASDPHVRIARPSHARWTPRMLVHEALPREGAEPLQAVVEHRFATSLESFRAKEERYALLWALQAAAEGRRGKWPPLQAPAHALRLALFKGALLRGGLPALRLAWGFGRYHARKYQLLRALRAGAHPELSRALQAGRLEELFRLLP